MNDWIKIIGEDNLPKLNEIVWVYEPDAVFETRKQRLMMFTNSKIWHDGTITHWKPKPEEPK